MKQKLISTKIGAWDNLMARTLDTNWGVKRGDYSISQARIKESRESGRIIDHKLVIIW